MLSAQPVGWTRTLRASACGPYQWSGSPITSRSSSTSGIVVSDASAAAASPLPNAKSSTFFRRYPSWVPCSGMPKAPSLFVVLDKWEISLAARLMSGLLVSNRSGPTCSRPPYTVWSRLIHRVERFGTKSHDPPRGGAKEGLGQHKHIFLLDIHIKKYIIKILTIYICWLYDILIN